MFANREGRFKASILEHGLDETGPNALATFICKFSLVQEWNGSEWMPVDEDLQITGYFYLEKKDASININTIDSLKSAFGWDGRDPPGGPPFDPSEQKALGPRHAAAYTKRTPPQRYQICACRRQAVSGDRAGLCGGRRFGPGARVRWALPG